MSSRELVDRAPTWHITHLDEFAWGDHGAPAREAALSATDQALGAAAFAVGVMFDPFVWVLAFILAWLALPRWWLVPLVGMAPAILSVMLAAQLAVARPRAPTLGQWLALAIAGAIATLIAAALIHWYRKTKITE